MCVWKWGSCATANQELKKEKDTWGVKEEICGTVGEILNRRLGSKHIGSHYKIHGRSALCFTFIIEYMERRKSEGRGEEHSWWWAWTWRGILWSKEALTAEKDDKRKKSHGKTPCAMERTSHQRNVIDPIWKLQRPQELKNMLRMTIIKNRGFKIAMNTLLVEGGSSCKVL